MPQSPRTSFGIMTAPQQVDYHDILQVWREADTIPAIEHAWLFDHLLPIGGGDPNGPIFEGWTVLGALAAQTHRLRLGLLVTSNRFRPPAMLAKIAATVDVISGGRLDFGIGVGGLPTSPWPREYAAYGLPFHDTAHAVASFAEACTVIRRLWTEAEPFDFTGTHHQLAGALCNPKPIQRPYPPIMIGGRSAATLRVAAEHADLWNIAGVDIDDAIRRSALLDRYCAQIGRDPAAVTRSIHLMVSYDRPGHTQAAIGAAIDAGFRHIVLGLTAPYPANVARWVTDEFITTSA